MDENLRGTGVTPWDEDFEKLCFLTFPHLRNSALIHRIYFIKALWEEFVNDAT